MHSTTKRDSMPKEDDDDDGSVRVNVRDRIAALNKESSSQHATPSTDGANRLRKTPSTSALLHARPNEERQDEGKASRNGLAPPLPPGRPRSSTGTDTASSSGRDSPKLDVKSIIGLYGSSKHVQGDASEVPEIPSRPSLGATSAAPSPPILPPRIRTGLVSRTNTGSSSSSSSTGSVSGSSLQQPALPYTPRRSPGIVAHGTNTPAVPARPTGNLGAGRRSADDLRPSDVGDANKRLNAAAPLLPPRTTTNALQQTRSHDTAIVAQSGAGTPRSQPSSPRAAPRLPSTRSPSSRAAPTSPLSTRASSTPISSSALSGTSSDAAPLAPPPRHIDTRRTVPGVPRIGGLEQSRQYLNSKKAWGRARRKRDEREEMVFVKEPTEQDKRRYGALFDRVIKEQVTRGGSSVVIEQRRIVRLWQRSKLDAWFLGQVWLRSTEERNVDKPGVRKDPFIRALCAIDAELARRREKGVAA